VVENSTSTEVTVSTTTYTDTGLSATITPISATSKVLVVVNQSYQFERNSNSQGGGIKVFRDSTEIFSPGEGSTGPVLDYMMTGTVTFINFRSDFIVNVLDSPSTTSAITYKTQGRPFEISGSGFIKFQSSYGVQNASSRIILMEVAA
jgi:hypothetical protein